MFRFDWAPWNLILFCMDCGRAWRSGPGGVGRGGLALDEVKAKMKITALEEYGLRCLVRVARQPGGEPISAQRVAELEGLSLPYAQKLLRVLATGELIEARRGASGGYVLARPVHKISLGDAIRALGGLIQLEDVCERHTGDREVCEHAQNCAIRPVWGYLSEFIVSTFDSIPLSLMLDDESGARQRLMALVPAPLEEWSVMDAARARAPDEATSTGT